MDGVKFGEKVEPNGLFIIEQNGINRNKIKQINWGFFTKVFIPLQFSAHLYLYIYCEYPRCFDYGNFPRPMACASAVWPTMQVQIHYTFPPPKSMPTKTLSRRPSPLPRIVGRIILHGGKGNPWIIAVWNQPSSEISWKLKIVKLSNRRLRFPSMNPTK